MKLSMREFFFAAVLMGVLAAAYYLVFVPANQRHQAAVQDRAAKNAKLAQLDVGQNITDLGKEIDRLGESIAVFEQKLPGARDEQVMLRQVWELAQKHKLTPRSVHADKPVPAAQYSELPLRMTIVGDFDGFYSFLLDLEKLRRITKIRDMQLKKVPGEEGQMEADMVLTIFFEPADTGEKGHT